MRPGSTAVFVLLFAGAALAAESPLLGKPLPEVRLSHAVQGAAWSQEDLKGSVVVLDVFQLG
ncbi:MAG: hypothetical protein ACE5JG_04275 [Planctomycetota bacterium]